MNFKNKNINGLTPALFIRILSRKDSVRSASSQKVWGFSLIEVVVGVSIIATVLISLVSTYGLFLNAALENTKKIQSAYLLEEGLEAIRSIRDESWSVNITPLETNVNYGLIFSDSKWSTSTPSFVDNVFWREFSVEEVERDLSDDITSSGIPDPNTKFFTVSVSWLDDGATTTKSISTYLSKIF